MKLLDAEPDFLTSPDGLIVRKNQIITSDFLEETKEARSRTGPAGEFMHVASIPTIVVEQWLREGFNIFEASAREIMKKLRGADLQSFLATEKRV